MVRAPDPPGTRGPTAAVGRSRDSGLQVDVLYNGGSTNVGQMGVVVAMPERGQRTECRGNSEVADSARRLRFCSDVMCNSRSITENSLRGKVRFSLIPKTDFSE